MSSRNKDKLINCTAIKNINYKDTTKQFNKSHVHICKSFRQFLSLSNEHYRSSASNPPASRITLILITMCDSCVKMNVILTREIEGRRKEAKIKKFCNST